MRPNRRIYISIVKQRAFGIRTCSLDKTPFLGWLCSYVSLCTMNSHCCQYRSKRVIIVLQQTPHFCHFQFGRIHFLALDQVWTIFYFILGTDNKTEIEQMQKLFVICCQFIDCLYSSPGKGSLLCLTISAINIFQQIGLLIG